MPIINDTRKIEETEINQSIINDCSAKRIDYRGRSKSLFFHSFNKLRNKIFGKEENLMKTKESVISSETISFEIEICLLFIENTIVANSFASNNQTMYSYL